LIFIHGSGQEGNFWQYQVEGLVDVANTIAVDLPGHGNSAGDGFKTVSDYAGAIADFIQTVKAPCPIPCGLSLGGAIVLQLLIDHAGPLKGGILANTGARLKVLPAIIENIERDYNGHLNGLIEFAVAPVNRSNVDVCRKVIASSTAGPVVTGNDFRACDAFDVMRQVCAIDLPVLVLSAECDILTPKKYADWLAVNIPTARHVSIADAGHMSPIERPEAFISAINHFLGTFDQ
jgi:pimeloyl-ACP methyl ester carboxylesterase